MTPHINAKKEDIANVVLMPGDPLRAKKIAETYLTDVKLVNDVRNMFMYTGTYKGKKITIAGSGMGCPSIGIYSYELFKFYDVDCIIRIGSAGSYKAGINVYDIYNVKDAFGESNYAKIAANLDGNIVPAGEKLFNLIEQTAAELNIKTHTGTAHSSDVFYRYEDSLAFAAKNNLDVVEMESFALFANAIVTNKQAACLLTISDSFITKEVTTAEERQNNFMTMVELSLQTGVKVAR
ncbi:purine nucleoside phosphorylase [Spiroplasma clarkii]|uniref:Uridine phosphorylase n=1 Tax=Spiroplasma clarkii TaxID=2139 RepID=A0A1Y0L3I2_9MOLU|nr:purine-nucleoside phosphorylase [Spiroplasma clarkii]ARU92275.1 purine nucleoside phosphorylase [Spiroplasma clarkii]ATX71587.1 purine nucleoside phosphorylase [Spiroplasma clarkii]